MPSEKAIRKYVNALGRLLLIVVLVNRFTVPQLFTPRKMKNVYITVKKSLYFLSYNINDRNAVEKVSSESGLWR